MRRTFLALTIATALTVALSACGSNRQQEMPRQVTAEVTDSNIPPWAAEGTGVYSGDTGRVLRSVGMITGVRNRSLAIQGAGQKARTEMARYFKTFVTDLMKIYQRSTTAGDMSASSEEQDIMNATKTFTEMELNGVSIVKTFCDRENPPTCYALAEMRFDDFKNFAAQQQELSAKVRDFVRDNADRAFDEMNAESEKARNRGQ